LEDSISRLIYTEHVGTHISNYDYWHYQLWPQVEDQLKYTDMMLQHTNCAFQQFFRVIVTPSCDNHGIMRHRNPNIINFLHQSDHANFIHDLHYANLQTFIKILKYNHGQRGYDGAVAKLVVNGVDPEDAPTLLGQRGYDCTIASLVADGIDPEDAPTVLGCWGYNGMIASLVPRHQWN
jgi:hypothetical protein